MIGINKILILLFTGGGGLFGLNHQIISCHSETHLARFSKLFDFFFFLSSFDHILKEVSQFNAQGRRSGMRHYENKYVT